MLNDEAAKRSQRQWQQMVHEAYDRLQNNEREKDPEVLRCMMRGGGSFVSNLAAAWLHADPVNNRKLFAAFGHYYDQYETALREENERRDQKAKD